MTPHGATMSTVRVNPAFHHALSDIICSKIGSYFTPHNLFNLILACKRFRKKVVNIDGLILSGDNLE